MIVCVCEGLSDRQLRAQVEAGCESVASLGRACGAGRSCGACALDLRRLVERHRGRAGAQAAGAGPAAVGQRAACA